MKKQILGIVLAGACAWAACGENAAPADERAATLPRKDNSAGSRVPRDRSGETPLPQAPAEYRRPANWKPAPRGPSLPELARRHSAEMMVRAKKEMDRVDAVNRAGKYHADGKSLDRHVCPEWFVDAKLGIFIDWGPWSVASWCPYEKGARLYPDWYELRCRPGFPGPTSASAYHAKNWGADFKSDDFLDLFRGERFDAPALMRLFRACGAKYVVPFLKHHGGFCLWDCSYTFRDSVDRGARRDFTREMVDACRKEGLKFGFYESQCGEWEYPILRDDGSLALLCEAKLPLKPYVAAAEDYCSGKIAVKDFVRDYTVPQAVEFIDKYDPDIFWGDYDWVTPAHANGSYDIAAYFYNHAEGRKEVAVNDRYGLAKPEEIAGRFTKKPRSWLRTVRGDFYTDEWGDTAECLDPAKWHPWESCSGISKAYGNHWMENYDASMVMDEAAFVCHLSDIVARGGNLLLLVNLDAQGAIPAVQKERLEQIGAWLKANGEAIYATRICAPFQTDAVDYTQSKDGGTVYAIVKKPAAEVTLDASAFGAAADAGKVTELSTGASWPCRRRGKAVVVSMPPPFASRRVPVAFKGAHVLYFAH